MLVLDGRTRHHCLLLPDDVGSTQYRVVSGNARYQSIMVETIDRSRVQVICSLNDFIPWESKR